MCILYLGYNRWKRGPLRTAKITPPRLRDGPNWEYVKIKVWLKLCGDYRERGQIFPFSQEMKFWPPTNIDPGLARSRWGTVWINTKADALISVRCALVYTFFPPPTPPPPNIINVGSSVFYFLCEIFWATIPGSRDTVIVMCTVILTSYPQILGVKSKQNNSLI